MLVLILIGLGILLHMVDIEVWNYNCHYILYFLYLFQLKIITEVNKELWP